MALCGGSEIFGCGRYNTYMKLLNNNEDSIQFVQNMDLAISVMQEAGAWLLEVGKQPSKWWQLQNLNKEFLSQYAKPDEFYVAMIDGEPAAAVILQSEQNSQDWPEVEQRFDRPSLYIHWLCVARPFHGLGLPKKIINFAEHQAKKKRLSALRLDTEAEEKKLCDLYKGSGFKLVTELDEEYQKTALFQKNL